MKANNTAFILWAALLTLLLGSLFLTAIPTQAAPPAQTPEEKPSVSGGQALWNENCLPCHGSTGKGDGPTAQSIPGPLPNFADPTTARQAIPIDHFNTIKNGRMDKMMPPWKNQLSDAEIWDAAAYVWQLGTPPQQLTRGEEIYQAQCAACHGNDGAGSGPEATAGINDFTDLTIMVEQSQADLFAAYNSSDQHADLTDLSGEDIWASLDYARSFSFALPARNGVLSGQVINAVTGQPVGDVEVKLHAFQNGSRLETLTAQTDTAGNYSFAKLLTDHTIMYMVESTYNNVSYVSGEPGMFVPDSNETTLNLEVYDSTTSAENINVPQLHYLLSFSPNAINVLQIFIIGNSGNATYVGENGETFAFELPADATNVNFQNDNGQRFIQTATGYADTEPIRPGEEGLSIAMVYDIPYQGNEATISLPLPHDVGSLDVLMADQGATLTSDQVQFIETRDFQGNSFAVLNGKDLKAGQTVNLTLTDLDSLEFAAPAANVMGSSTTASTTWFDQQLALWIILGTGLVAVVVAGVGYPIARAKLTPSVDNAADTPETRRKKLILMLARLDDAYENGELDDNVYHRARNKYKAELADLMELV